MSYGIIYKATGPTGKVYIGQTTDSLSSRKGKHAYRVKKMDRRAAFQIALLEHGFSTFTWEQIDTAESKEELDTKEKQWIAHYKADDLNFGYNATDGGINTRFSPETCLKISEALKGKPSWNKGKHHTPEHCQKISEANKGKPKGNAGEKHPFYRKHRSAETRQKISEALRGRTLSDETRRKMSEAWRKRKSS